MSTKINNLIKRPLCPLGVRGPSQALRASSPEIRGDFDWQVHKFRIISAIHDESKISKAKHFLPKSLRDAPI